MKLKCQEGIMHTRSIASCSAGVTLIAWGISCSGWSNKSLKGSLGWQNHGRGQLEC